MDKEPVEIQVSIPTEEEFTRLLAQPKARKTNSPYDQVDRQLVEHGYIIVSEMPNAMRSLLNNRHPQKVFSKRLLDGRTLVWLDGWSKSE